MAGLEEGYSPKVKIFALTLTSELGLTAVRSRSSENNIQLFSYTLAPLRYALFGENANPAPAALCENPSITQKKSKPNRKGSI